MDLGHVVYKVDNLEAATTALRDRGLVVEYGRARKPYNALAYFSDGPYLELLGSTGIPRAVARVLPLFRGPRSRALSKLASWDKREEGLCGLCLEGDDARFRAGIEVLGRQGAQLRAHRTDPAGRTLRYRVFFPADWDLPFLMTHFSVDPRPSDFTHPGGARRIASVCLPLPQTKHALVRSLCDDDALVLVPPDEPMQVTFDDGTMLPDRLTDLR